MDSVEENIRSLLQGDGSDEPDNYCDFSLDDQNEVTGKISLRFLTFF